MLVIISGHIYGWFLFLLAIGLAISGFWYLYNGLGGWGEHILATRKNIIYAIITLTLCIVIEWHALSILFDNL